MEKEAAAAKSILSTLKSPTAKKIAMGVTAVGAIGASGAIGHRVGYKSGAVRAANALTGAFSEANARENQKIVDSFNAFNKMENAEIAKGFYNKGLKEAKMKKMSSYAENIYNQAFEDEIEKNANMLGTGLTTLSKSFKSLGKGLKGLKGKTMKQMPGQLWRTAKKSKAALGTIGVGALGAGAVGAGLASD